MRRHEGSGLCEKQFCLFWAVFGVEFSEEKAGPVAFATLNEKEIF